MARIVVCWLWSWDSPLRRWCALVAVSVTAAVGCSAPGTALENAPEVTVMSAGAVLRDPVWSYRIDALVGLTDDDRLAEITDLLRPGHATTRLSPPIAVGRNLQISRKDDRHIFVPQPQGGKVAVIDLATLRQVDDFDAGPAPAYLSEDAGMRVLLALSADGSSVTPIDEYGFRALPTAEITGDPSDVIDGANRGREIEYHVYGSSGIRYYKGPSSPLPSPIRRIGTDDTRIYAATDREVVVLETNDVTGYPHHTIPVLRTTNYRTGLPDAERSAPLTGMALGPHRVYLTFAGTPLVVSVAKPRL
jgi:hypothetical protein